ncbi:hypothetical protein [Bathymodiolus japonicus methanotrophic gill symbiont]|uniref:hypothetical protein n=1 Tax=Bathymodiolus japonicus methanotrophic gill symbiont TaxID=113269 RepID=UPI001C8CF7F7|nr:hypothetical protein [Bathymodiolus japonicus methanotrophic gill symbiont]
MLMNAPATFIQSYIDDLNDALNQLKPGAALTRIQAAWLGTCLTYLRDIYSQFPIISMS